MIKPTLCNHSNCERLIDVEKGPDGANRCGGILFGTVGDPGHGCGRFFCGTYCQPCWNKLKEAIWRKGNSPQEHAIADVLRAARDVQDFLWGTPDQRPEMTMSRLVRELEKRIRKLDEVDLSRPTHVVEVRKRLLQVAALSIAWIERIELAGKLQP